MTLSDLAYKARIAIKVGGAFFVAIVLVYAVIAFVFMQVGNKTPEVEPQNLNIAFANVPPVSIEQALDLDGARYTYLLNTIDNDYPVTTSAAEVFFVPTKNVTLSYTKQADAIAQEFGFDTDAVRPKRLNEGEILYEDANKRLDVDIRNFNYTFSLKSSPSLQELVEATPSADVVSLEDSWKSMAQNIFLQSQSGNDVLSGASTNVVYVSYDLSKGTYTPIDDETQPQAVRIDFFKKDDLLPIVSPYFFTSQNYVILAPLTPDATVVQAQIKTYPKLLEGAGRYPLITAEEAWKQLESHKAKVVSIADNPELPIKINNIYVAYYDPESYQQYYQPVFVFLGSDNFVAYLPAIKLQYLLK